MTRRNAQPEMQLQAAVLEYLRMAHPRILVAAVPNGGFIMDPRTVARLKWQGLLPGFPDLVLYWANHGHGLLEIKSEGGRISPEQKAVHAALEALGWRVSVIRSLDDLWDTLADWGVERRNAA